MTKYGEILEKLKPLKRAQYYGLLEYLQREDVIFDAHKNYKMMLKDLGLTPTEYKKAINWFVDNNLITVKESRGEIKASLTDFTREML